jgi:alkylation response protein AidB-like acyl-CoA dehydrogenase
MKFDLSEEQALLRQTTRDFLSSEWPPERMRRVMEDEPRGYTPADWQRLAQMGYLGLILPANAGGQGLGAIELAVVLEEVGRACVPGPYLDAVLAAATLAAAGGQEAVLSAISAGTQLVTLAREDAPFRSTKVTPTRYAGGRVRGRKYFVPFAAQADALLVATPDTLCLVRKPFDVIGMPTLDPAQRFGEVSFDHAATPVGSASLLERSDRLAAVSASAMLLGIMNRAMEMTLAYVQTRQAFKRPIGSFQALQHRLADMLLKTESTRSAVYRAAWCYDTNDRDAPLACAAAKAYAGDAARLVCGESIQMHGGIGFTWELDLHFYFKRAKTLEQFYGSTEVQLEQALAAAGF